MLLLNPHCVTMACRSGPADLILPRLSILFAFTYVGATLDPSPRGDSCW